MRIVSGIQPSGQLHLGNYFGTLKQQLQFQGQYELFYFIANLHALTTVHESEKLRRLTLELAAGYLALGLNPHSTIFFRQSDLPEVCELSWILSTVTGKGLLERAHLNKDRAAKGIPISLGEFIYPLLMASDILILKGDRVPVGRDQVQHLEMARDIAQSFNNRFTPVLTLPEPVFAETPIVPGLDGQKMSKSRSNAIGIFEPLESVRGKIMAIKTDSLPVSAPKDPASNPLLSLLGLFAGPDELIEWSRRYEAGGLAYLAIKERIIQLFEITFAGFRDSFNQWLAHSAEIEAILASGADRARKVARGTLEQVHDACGIRTMKASEH